MNVGIVCYASVGGSGIVATELAKALADRQHQVRLISTEMPFRVPELRVGLAFHAVHTPGYPLFREPQYLLSLANKIVQVSREYDLDIIHAHYAIPHAAAAYLARQILANAPGTKVPRVITTLHGTDVTLIGSDSSYSETAAFCIDQSDGVTAVSESLRENTYRQLSVRADIQVIPNFLDCSYHHRSPDPALRARFTGGDAGCRVVIHVSNFRPVKRAEAVIDIFDRIRQRVPSRLLLVGDGPDLDKAGRRARELGLSDVVEQLGEQEEVVPLLSVADLFLLPSEQESFGLAALEAMACQLPVVASRVGGLPEVVDDGVTGFLHHPDDIDGMAASGVALLADPARHLAVAEAALAAVQQRFCANAIVPRYEALYKRILDREPVPAISQ
ncbi:MAG: N-acetyl-alpha-D-glucosaminyl L-malate synthase BshA [Vicinamibacterales bacterium]|jgi:N-acetyl-alpha-D-glucosaminyl L-malate synthase BshA|nr:N-acetyl-alpha-D-glucosaminyl L-malate synthase BshA [Vicinamibacterales bacterium]